jgi:hypothetical protein
MGPADDFDRLLELTRWAFYPGYKPRFALPPGSYTLIVCDRAWQELRRFPVVLDADVVELDVGE